MARGWPLAWLGAPLLVAAILAGGCGAESLPDRSPQATLTTYLRAVAAGNRGEACALSVHCSDEVVDDTSRAGASDELHWRLRYRVSAGEQLAEVAGSGSQHGSRWQLERRKGRWRVAEGTQYRASS